MSLPFPPVPCRQVRKGSARPKPGWSHDPAQPIRVSQPQEFITRVNTQAGPLRALYWMDLQKLGERSAFRRGAAGS